MPKKSFAFVLFTLLIFVADSALAQIAPHLSAFRHQKLPYRVTSFLKMDGSGAQRGLILRPLLLARRPQNIVMLTFGSIRGPVSWKTFATFSISIQFVFRSAKLGSTRNQDFAARIIRAKSSMPLNWHSSMDILPSYRWIGRLLPASTSLLKNSTGCQTIKLCKHGKIWPRVRARWKVLYELFARPKEELPMRHAQNGRRAFSR